MHDMRDRLSGRGPDNQQLWLALGAGAVIGAVGLAYLKRTDRDGIEHRPPDSAPGRTARRRRFGRYAVTGRTVTINRPRDELYAFWRNFANLPKFMENVVAVTENGELTRWQIRGPAGRNPTIDTRIVEEREGELIAWRSVAGSEIDTKGRIAFRDAPAGRGTEVEAIVAYRPPAGELGRWVAKLFQAEPSLQGRRELKRFKMLMETGEIATNRNRNAAA
jgi:uncharacterized membrane protein